VHSQLAALVDDFARQGYRPDVLQPFATVDEARQRWAALRTFAQTHGHFLVTNGPYRIAQWSTQAVVLEVFCDLSYPLGVGSYDRYAIPRRAYISQITPHAQGFEIHAEVERVEKFQRTMTLFGSHCDVSSRRINVLSCPSVATSWCMLTGLSHTPGQRPNTHTTNC